MASTIPKPDTEFPPQDELDEAAPYVPLLGGEAVLNQEGEIAGYIVTPAEWRRMYDEAAQKYMGMSGDEFLRRWDAGEWHELYDKPGYWYVGYLVDMRPFDDEES